MNFLRAGVFLPITNSSVLRTALSDWTSTGTSLAPSEMNCLNSCGLISPSPLKRVISAPAISLVARSRSASL